MCRRRIQIGRGERATRHLLFSGRWSWLEGNDEQYRTQEEPQRWLAKWPNETRTVHAGSELAQVIGLKLNRKAWILHDQSKIKRTCFIESQRMRTTKKWGESSPGPHHKPILILKSVELPAAKTAMDKDGNKWRTKQLSPCGEVNQHKDTSCWSNTNTTQEATSHTRDHILRTILVWRQGLCHCYGFFTTLHSIRRRRDGSNIHWHQQRQKTKQYVHAQSTSKITRLAQKIGSCRNSKPAKFLVLWNTRFTRQQLLCPVKQRKWRGRLRLWSFQSSSDCLCQPT